ncbi:MAG: thiosulfate oxidation carrier protein SoxY [Pseudomonadota bacterium]
MLNRRTFLQNTMGTGAIAVAASCGLLVPGSILAAWNKAAFDAKGLASAMKATGEDSAVASDKIKIKAPDIAENGAVVPVTITTTIAGVESITIYAENNGTPLSAKFNLAKNAEPYISTRIKMGKTSNVIAVVTAGGKQYKAHKEVKVTIGGCGG